ncbi:MAG: hypothetical protein DMF91_04570 [Acidobacteria bacterium]|nr:MAG: hypothetical protein DMF91_04570 [Acidobacteriota bacterium]
MACAGVKPADVQDVVMGCVLQAGAGMNVARQAALRAGLQEGRLRNGRERLRHQRRRRRACRDDGGEGESDRHGAAGPHPRVRVDRRRSDDHGHGSDARRPPTPRARAVDDQRHRSL